MERVVVVGHAGGREGWTLERNRHQNPALLGVGVEVEELEEFEMLKTLGKFSSIPEEIVKMRSNFFSDKYDATSKQIQYMRYLATSNRVIPPLKLGSSHECDIDPVSDKSMLRSWISLEVSRNLKSAMM